MARVKWVSRRDLRFEKSADPTATATTDSSKVTKKKISTKKKKTMKTKTTISAFIVRYAVFSNVMTLYTNVVCSQSMSHKLLLLQKSIMIVMILKNISICASLM
jgi:hypothetical protein